MDGRTFYPGDDPFWEAVDLWYGATADLEWYDPSQVITKDGNLQITMDLVQDPTQNHLLQYKSGMLQSWNKFCFTSGYIEVAVSLPGPNSDTQGYVSDSSIYSLMRLTQCSAFSGRVSGRWATWADLAMEQLPMGCGLTRTPIERIIHVQSTNLDLATVTATLGRSLTRH